MRMVNLGGLFGVSLSVDRLAQTTEVLISREPIPNGFLFCVVMYGAEGLYYIGETRNMTRKRANALRLRIQRKVTKAKAAMQKVEEKKALMETAREYFIRESNLKLVAAAHPIQPAATVNNFYNYESTVIATDNSVNDQFFQYVTETNVSLSC